MQQHLGNYHQSVPTLFGDALFCATLPAVRNPSSLLETQEYGVNFVHINILNCPLFPPSHPLARFFSSPFFLLTGPVHASASLSFHIFREWIALHCHWAPAKNSFLAGQMFQNVIFDRNQPAWWIQAKPQPADLILFSLFRSSCLLDCSHTVQKAEECPYRNQYQIKTLLAHE